MNRLTSLETPALLLDHDRLQANCARMRGHLSEKGVLLRPHVKTAKSVDVVKLALGGKVGPITVSTLKEAEHFHQHGFNDILYAVCMAPNKLPRAAALRRAGGDLKIILDNEAMARALVDFCRAEAIAIPALIEIDVDGHRSGLRPDSTKLDATAQLLADEGLFAGLMTHAGACYSSTSLAEIRQASKDECERISDAAARLRAGGLAVPIVSVGSTPTALFGDAFEDVTEVRAGVYMFFDLVLHGLGVCRIEEIALSVLTTVIGHRPDTGWLITDGGWMAVSRDRGTAKQKVDQGYGIVCDSSLRPVRDFFVVETSQEHGIVASRSGSPIDSTEYPVGTQLRILPIHACATSAQHERFDVVDSRNSPLARWSKLGGW